MQMSTEMSMKFEADVLLRRSSYEIGLDLIVSISLTLCVRYLRSSGA